MDRTKPSPQQLHFHIRWSGKAELDWECFSTRAEAETGADQLVRSGETYIIEEYGPACPRCAVAFELKMSHDKPAETPPLKYRWQQTVMEAFTEKRPDVVPRKVNAAQRAISARLCDPALTDLDEKIAIHEALQSLRALIPEPKKESGEKHNSAEKASA